MKNNNTQINKKIFIAGKVYDLQVMDKDMVKLRCKRIWITQSVRNGSRIQAMQSAI